MTDQERQLLQELATRVQKSPPPQIDGEADDLIRRTLGTRPDALYILTQTVLIQEMALNQAKQQIDELRKQQPPTSFLGNAASRPDPNIRTEPRPYNDSNPSADAPRPSGYRSSSYQTGYTPPPPPVRQAAVPPPVPEQPQYAAPAQPSGFSGFLHNAMQTAAGVMAGEVAFSALSSMFGHRGVYGGGGVFGGGSFLEGGGNVVSPVSETIINNYYDEPRGEHGGHGAGFATDDLGPGQDLAEGGRHHFADPDRITADDSAADTSDEALDSDNSADDAADAVSDDDYEDSTTDDQVSDLDDGSAYDDGSDNSQF